MVFLLISSLMPAYANSSDTDMSKTFYIKANQFLLAKDYDKAIENYITSIKYNPKFFQAHFELGFAYHNKGFFQNAVMEYRLALNIQPENPDVYYNLGTALLKEGSLDEGIAALQKTITLRPDNAYAYYNLALIMLKQDKLDEALEYFTLADKLLPDNNEIKRNIELVNVKKKEKLTINMPLADYNVWVPTSFSLILPGTGQLYKSEFSKGILYLVVFGIISWEMWDRYLYGDENYMYWGVGLAGINLISALDAYFNWK